MPATNKLVIQYPPGTGFVLALFPSGFQVIPLYVIASLVAAGFACSPFPTPPRIFVDARRGLRGPMIYLMINPTKASYSMAPTMMVCALAGLSDREALRERRAPFACFLTILIGL